MSNRLFWLVIAGGLIVVVVGVALAGSLGSDPTVVGSALIDKPAPEIVVDQLDGTGEVRLSDHAGDVVTESETEPRTAWIDTEVSHGGIVGRPPPSQFEIRKSESGNLEGHPRKTGAQWVGDLASGIRYLVSGREGECQPHRGCCPTMAMCVVSPAF